MAAAPAKINIQGTSKCGRRGKECAEMPAHAAIKIGAVARAGTKIACRTVDT